MSARGLRPKALLALWTAMRGRRRPGAPSAWSALRTLPRLLTATATGRYRGASPGQLALMLLALAYIVSPVDLVPELAFLGVGLLDDAVVLAWLAGTVLTETDAFRVWEREQRAGRGSTGRAREQHTPFAREEGGAQDDDADVVVGEVIR